MPVDITAKLYNVEDLKQGWQDDGADWCVWVEKHEKGESHFNYTQFFSKPPYYFESVILGGTECTAYSGLSEAAVNAMQEVYDSGSEMYVDAVKRINKFILGETE